MRMKKDDSDVVCRCLTGEDNLEGYALASEELESDVEHLLRDFLFCDDAKHDVPQCTNATTLTNTMSTPAPQAGGQECHLVSEAARVRSLDSSLQDIFNPVLLVRGMGGAGDKTEPHPVESTSRCAGHEQEQQKQLQRRVTATGTDDGSETERRDGVSDTTGEMTRSARSAEGLVVSDGEAVNGVSVVGGTPRWVTASPSSAATSMNTQSHDNKLCDKPAPVPAPDAATDGGSSGTVLSKLNVYITGLPNSWNTKVLRTECLRFGDIVSAVVQHHPETNDSRQYGFVMFKTEESARRCIEYMNNRIVLPDRPPLQCHYAKEDATPLAVQQKLRRTTAQGEEVLDGEVIMPVEVLAAFYREVRRVCAEHVTAIQQQQQSRMSTTAVSVAQNASPDDIVRQDWATDSATESAEEAEERQALGLDHTTYNEFQRMIKTCVVYGNHVHALTDVTLTASARALFAASPATTSRACDDVPEPLRRVLLWQMSLPMDNKGSSSSTACGATPRHYATPPTALVTHKLSYVCLVFVTATAASEFLRSAVTTQQDKTAQPTPVDSPQPTATARAAQLMEATFCRQGKVASIMTSLTTAADSAVVRGLRRYTAVTQPRVCGRPSLATPATVLGTRRWYGAPDGAAGIAAAGNDVRRHPVELYASSIATLPPAPSALIGQAVVLNSMNSRGYPAAATYPPPPPPLPTSMGVLPVAGTAASLLARTPTQLPPPPPPPPLSLHEQPAMLSFVTLGATGQAGTPPVAPGATYVLLNHPGPALQSGASAGTAVYMPGPPAEGGGQRGGLMPYYVTLQPFSTDGASQLTSRCGGAAPAMEVPTSLAYSLLPSIVNCVAGAAPQLWRAPYYTPNPTGVPGASLPPFTNPAFAASGLPPPAQLAAQQVSFAPLMHPPQAPTVMPSLTPEMTRGTAVPPLLARSATTTILPQPVSHVL